MQSTNADGAEIRRECDRTESYLRFDPTNKLLLTRAIELNLALVNTDAALAHARAATAAHPDDIMLQCLLAHAHAARREWDLAAPIYASLIETRSEAGLAFSLANCPFQRRTAISAPFISCVKNHPLPIAPFGLPTRSSGI